MIILRYPELFEEDPDWNRKALALANKSYEFVNFLHDVVKAANFPVSYQGSLTYHDSCSSLRETNVKQQTRNLINSTILE